MKNNQDNQTLHEALQSIARLKRERLADLERIAEIERTLASLSDPKANTCQNCSKYGTCTDTCDKVENWLSQEHQGHHSKEQNYGDLINHIGANNPKNSEEGMDFLHKYDASFLKDIDKVRSDDILILYKNCIQRFSKAEWRVIMLRIDEGLTFKQIGIILGKETSTVSSAFYKAKKSMEQHYQEYEKRK